MRQRRKFIRPQKREKRPRSNDQITAPEVMLIDDEGGTETLSVADALERARTQELDLIEVSPKARPPVVKIGDLGQYLYHVQKKERKQRASNKQKEMKMLRFSFRTEKHDTDRIIDRAREFLGDRHFVKLVIRLRGRELTNTDYARDKLNTVVKSLEDIADIEQETKRQGNQFIVVLRPKK
jgi:translation initiation factor IF-3